MLAAGTAGGFPAVDIAAVASDDARWMAERLEASIAELRTLRR